MSGLLRYTELMAQAQRKEDVLEAALQLDPLDRARVAHELIASIEGHANVDAGLLEQLEDQIDVAISNQILAEMKASGEQPVAWEDTKKRLGL